MSETHHPAGSRILIRLLIWGVVATLIIGSWIGSEFDLGKLGRSGPQFLEFFMRLTPPDWTVLRLVSEATVETLMIAMAGTSLAFIISLPLGFLAASNITPPWISQPIRWMLSVIRSIPLILVAIIFVAAVGLGPFPGALAIAFHSIGMLGKFYGEEFETADQGIIDAVSGTGATWMQTVRYGLFPQCVPQVLSFTIYRLEMNFRDAAVLGLVGAGGIGYYIILYVKGFQYEKVAILLLVIIAVVLIFDQLTFWLRRLVQ